jgi:DDE superfamily endonuclease
MSGEKLQPYVIFKGVSEPRSRISRTFSDLPAGALYSVQRNAWTDMNVMLDYIDRVLTPFMHQHAGQRGLLLLDNFVCHMNEQVKAKLGSICLDLLFIPKGMTGLLQPLDISINRPFKLHLSSTYTDWLVSQIDLQNVLARRPKPTRLLIAQWILLSWHSINPHGIQRAFGQYNMVMRPTIMNEEGHALLLLAQMASQIRL